MELLEVGSSASADFSVEAEGLAATFGAESSPIPSELAAFADVDGELEEGQQYW